MSRYILFFFSLIFVFSNKVQTTDYMGTLDTSSGYCDLKDFGLGKVKVGEEKYDYRNCQVARCEKGRYHINGCMELPDYDEDSCDVYSEAGPDIQYPDRCPRIICEKKEFYELSYEFFSTLKRLLSFHYV
nr:Tx-628 [Heteropoda pingtungensis]